MMRQELQSVFYSDEKGQQGATWCLVAEAKVRVTRSRGPCQL